MVQTIIIVEKSAALKSLTVKDYKESELYEPLRSAEKRQNNYKHFINRLKETPLNEKRIKVMYLIQLANPKNQLQRYGQKFF